MPSASTLKPLLEDGLVACRRSGLDGGLVGEAWTLGLVCQALLAA